LRAQSQVRVLAVEKEILVEQSDYLQHRTPVQRCRRAWQQHFFLAIEFRGRKQMAALFARGIAVDHHARRIQMLFSEEPYLRRKHAGIRMRLRRRHQRFNPAGSWHGIVVQRRHILGPALMKREVDGRAKTYVAPRLDDHRAPTPGFSRAH
jgi:hypothetical protein